MTCRGGQFQTANNMNQVDKNWSKIIYGKGCRITAPLIQIKYNDVKQRII